MEIENLLIIPDKNNIDESLRLAKEYNCGFEYNDFFLPDLLDNQERLAETIEFYKSLGDIPQYCTCHGAFLDVTIFSDDARIREVSDYRVEQSLSIAEQLGAKAVVFHTNYLPNFNLSSYRDGWVQRNYEYWSKKLEKYNKLNIYMENMFDSDWRLLVSLAERLKDRDNFGICFDYAHAHVFGDENEIDDWVLA
ncbi:MAG: TIM barrel protein, partial [Wujia sp.]